MGVFEIHAAIEDHEALAGESEFHHQHGAGLAAGAIHDVALHLGDARVRQQGDIEIRRLLGLAVGPEAGGDLGHEATFPRVVVRHRPKDDRGWAIPTAAPAETPTFLGSSEFRRSPAFGWSGRRIFAEAAVSLT